MKIDEKEEKERKKNKRKKKERKRRKPSVEGCVSISTQRPRFPISLEANLNKNITAGRMEELNAASLACS